MRLSKAGIRRPPLAGKAALVPGGSRGIGAAIARAFAAAGAKNEEPWPVAQAAG